MTTPSRVCGTKSWESSHRNGKWQHLTDADLQPIISGMKEALPVYLFSLFLLAFAISLDGFSVGTIYGLRKMRIPLSSILIISACSFMMIILSMTIGGIIEPIISPNVASSIGGWILVVIGLGTLLQYLRGLRKTPKKHRLFNIKFKQFGVVTKIFREPASADLDQSGIISGAEAFLLGLALSFDAFGAGIGAAFLGYSAVFTAFLVAFMSALFLWAGKTVGYLFSEVKWIKKASFIPGILLILIGVWKILTG